MSRAYLASAAIILAVGVPRGDLTAQDAVPAHEEARHHLVLDDERFRILDIRIPPGDTTDFHLHDVPIAYVAISPAAVGTQRMGAPWSTAARSATPEMGIGRVTWNESYLASPVVHRVTNADDHPFRLIGVVNRGAGDPAPDPAALGVAGPASASSRWYRTATLTVEGGASIEWTAHPRPVIAVLVSDGSVSLATGEITAAGIGGFVVLDAGETHTLQVVAGDRVTLALLEVR